MFARAHSGAVIGVDAREVIVECNQGKGLPGAQLIGMARGAVRESLIRVRAGIAATGLSLQSQKRVINLLPAELPKDNSALDLATAAALLACEQRVPVDGLAGRRFYGEVSLGGAVEAVRGAVLMAELARQKGDRELLVAEAVAAEAAIIPGIRVIPIGSLDHLVDHLRGRPIPTAEPTVSLLPPARVCLSEVRGHAIAKRALEIAAAGRHNLLMIGPPGAGKSMLARRLPTLLPELEPEERIEVTRIQSVAGVLRESSLVSERPFRAPHHTASEPALCGGGATPRPGEITLAHRGVLFLDELPEFSRRALESMREPLEEGAIHVARSMMTTRMPADVLLIAAMNPCPCGHFGTSSTRRPCLCPFERVTRYQHRISGPVLDRIDLRVRVESVPYTELLSGDPGEPSATVRRRVIAAHATSLERNGGRPNSRLSNGECMEILLGCAGGARRVAKAEHEHELSTRAVTRITKVARTIADLAASHDVGIEHIEEAIDFRMVEGLGGG